MNADCIFVMLLPLKNRMKKASLNVLVQKPVLSTDGSSDTIEQRCPAKVCVDGDVWLLSTSNRASRTEKMNPQFH